MSYDCFYEASSSEKGHRFIAGLTVPVQTVCPCSKAISDGGAHNQRGVVTLQVSLGPFFWFEDLIRIVEESGSSELFTLLKREDEKFITEKAYGQPRFVEMWSAGISKVDALLVFRGSRSKRKIMRVFITTQPSRTSKRANARKSSL